MWATLLTLLCLLLGSLVFWGGGCLLRRNHSLRALQIRAWLRFGSLLLFPTLGVLFLSLLLGLGLVYGFPLLARYSWLELLAAPHTFKQTLILLGPSLLVVVAGFYVLPRLETRIVNYGWPLRLRWGKEAARLYDSQVNTLLIYRDLWERAQRRPGDPWLQLATERAQECLAGILQLEQRWAEIGQQLTAFDAENLRCALREAEQSLQQEEVPPPLRRQRESKVQALRQQLEVYQELAQKKQLIAEFIHACPARLDAVRAQILRLEVAEKEVGTAPTSEMETMNADLEDLRSDLADLVHALEAPLQSEDPWLRETGEEEPMTEQVLISGICPPSKRRPTQD